MILLDLFIGFLKVGLFSFGGAYAAIPLIREVVIEYAWLDEDMLEYMIAVSESTPGSIMVNVATYVGGEKAGISGAAIATIAVVLPAFMIVLLITAVLSKVIGNGYVQAVLRGLKACIIGIIFTTGAYMIYQNIFTGGVYGYDFGAVIITVILAIIYFGTRVIFKKGISPIILIAISAVLGIVIYSI